MTSAGIIDITVFNRSNGAGPEASRGDTMATLAAADVPDAAGGARHSDDSHARASTARRGRPDRAVADPALSGRGSGGFLQSFGW
jgi:hypothetical protein